MRRCAGQCAATFRRVLVRWSVIVTFDVTSKNVRWTWRGNGLECCVSLTFHKRRRKQRTAHDEYHTTSRSRLTQAVASGVAWRHRATTAFTASRAPRVDQSEVSGVVASGATSSDEQRRAATRRQDVASPYSTALATRQIATQPLASRYATRRVFNVAQRCALPSLVYLFSSSLSFWGSPNLARIYHCALGELGRNCRESIRSRSDQRLTSQSCSTKRTMDTIKYNLRHN